jgi:hypothetical protein
MAANKLSNETPKLIWDGRDDPNRTFRILEIMLRDLQLRIKRVVDDHADLIDKGQLLSYTVAGVPSASPAGQMIFVSDEAGGAVPAFSDGTNWRRVTDRAVVS